MKRAEAEIIGSSFFKLHKTANCINNINTAQDLLYGILGNQNTNIRTANIAKTFEEFVTIKLLNPEQDSKNPRVIP